MRWCDCFIINYGHLDNAIGTATRIQAAGANATVLSVAGSPADDHAAYSSRADLLAYPPGHYYGHLWNEAIRLHDSEIVGIITSDVRIPDVARLLTRMGFAFATFDRLWCYAPNVEYTPWQYRLHRLRRLSADLYHVPNTDGMCWFLRTDLLRTIGPLPLDVNYLGWGVDVLAGIYCARDDKYIVRDYGIAVNHPAGTGYSREEASRQEFAMAEHLGMSAEYYNYLHSAHSVLIERSARYPHGSPRRMQQRIRPQLRQPRAF